MKTIPVADRRTIPALTERRYRAAVTDSRYKEQLLT